MITQLIFGEDLSAYILGENGVINIVEIFKASTAVSHYQVMFANGLTEEIYDFKRVTRRV